MRVHTGRTYPGDRIFGVGWLSGWGFHDLTLYLWGWTVTVSWGNGR